MSDIKTRKYRCNGCGEDRPCYLITNQEPHTLDYMQIYDLKCVLDETNQTSYNWNEVQANEVEYRADRALHKHIVSVSAYDWKKEQAKNFCRNRECPFYDGWNYGCKQRSDAQKCATRQFY